MTHLPLICHCSEILSKWSIFDVICPATTQGQIFGLRRDKMSFQPEACVYSKKNPVYEPKEHELEGYLGMKTEIWYLDSGLTSIQSLRRLTPGCGQAGQVIPSSPGFVSSTGQVPSFPLPARLSIFR
jgi:hypothetical protein